LTKVHILITPCLQGSLLYSLWYYVNQIILLSYKTADFAWQPA